MERSAMEINKLEINGKAFEYRINYGDTISVEIIGPDGQKKTLEVTSVLWNELRKDILFHTNEKIYKARILHNCEKSISISFVHSSNQFTVDQVAKKAKVNKKEVAYPATTASPNKDEVRSDSFKSPLAGRVTKLLIKYGDQVEKGQPLVIIESMKMENELCAHRSAFIKTIFISEGNVVQQNHVLLEFENKRGEDDAGAQSTNGEKTVSDRRSSQGA